MKKICFLTQWMNTFGGLQRVVVDIANTLSMNGYDVTICTLDKDEIYYHVNENIDVVYNNKLSYTQRNIFQKIFGYLINRNVIKISNQNLVRKIYFPKKRIELLNKYLNNNNFDTVISVAGELSMLLCLTNSNCKKIGWQHSTYDAYYHTVGKYCYGLEDFAKSVLPKLSRNIVLTKEIQQDYMQNIGLESIVINNPISFQCNSCSSQISNKLLFVGRLIKDVKGLDYLMEIINYVLNKNEKWECVIVGDGTDKNYLANKIIELDLSNKVKLIGRKMDMMQYYLDSSILLNTSRWEGFGLTIIEAMECGVVPISFNHSGAKEIIDASFGVLIDSFNVNDYEQELLDLMKSYDKRNRMSKIAKDKAKEYHIDLIINKWIQII